MVVTLSVFWQFHILTLLILTLLYSDTFISWYFQIMTLSDCNISRFWHFQIPALSDSNTFRFRNLKILMLSKHNTFRFWHVQLLYRYLFRIHHRLFISSRSHTGTIQQRDIHNTVHITQLNYLPPSQAQGQGLPAATRSIQRQVLTLRKINRCMRGSLVDQTGRLGHAVPTSLVLLIIKWVPQVIIFI